MDSKLEIGSDRPLALRKKPGREFRVGGLCSYGYRSVCGRILEDSIESSNDGISGLERQAGDYGGATEASYRFNSDSRRL